MRSLRGYRNRLDRIDDTLSSVGDLDLLDAAIKWVIGAMDDGRREPTEAELRRWAGLKLARDEGSLFYGLRDYARERLAEMEAA